MVYRFLWLLLFPLTIWGQVHEVPINTKGNVLILSVSNETISPLENLKVSIQTNPHWLFFEQNEFSLTTIQPHEQFELNMKFEVFDTEVNKVDSVIFNIEDEFGYLINQRILKFKAYAKPQETKLDAPFPNPGNPGTTIRYCVHEPSHILVEIYNILGQQVIKLVDEEKPIGIYNLHWDGKNLCRPKKS